MSRRSCSPTTAARARARTRSRSSSGCSSAFPVRAHPESLARHDFSRWLADVFRDHPLAGHVRELERRAATEDARMLAADIAQSIRARYETAAEFDESLGRS